MKTRWALAAAALVLSTSVLPSCGGGGGSTTPTPTTLPPVPAVAVTTAGSGDLVLHPSLDSRFFFALETPIRIQETAGGNADWNFARIQYFRNGRENERFELGADVIDRAGFKRIAARSNQVYRVIFRNNDENFDDITITLGFSDIKDGRQFTTTVGLATFNDVTFSVTPLRVPDQGAVHYGK
jgi:hypothetical protein